MVEAQAFPGDIERPSGPRRIAVLDLEALPPAAVEEEEIELRARVGRPGVHRVVNE